MINLLPPATQSAYSYGRRNVVLRRWIIALVIVFIGLAAIATFGLVSLQQQSTAYRHRVAASQTTLKKENFQATQAEVQQISSSFKLVLKVLGNEVLFSQMLKQIAATIPANANLTGLTINQTQGGIDISANATDYNTATQVQVNLADPKNKLFSKADIVSVNCEATPAADTNYPCIVTIRALFAADNPFLFINNKAVKP